MMIAYFELRRVLKSILAGAFLTCLLSSPLMAQQQYLQPVKCTTWKDRPITTDIDCRCVAVGGSVEAVYVDTLHAIAYTLVRAVKRDRALAVGFVAGYDLKAGKQMWFRPFNFIDDKFFLADTLPVWSNEHITEGLSRHDGTVRWSAQMSVGLVTDAGIGVVKIPAGFKYDVAGVDLRNGEIRWRKSAGLEDIESLELLGDTAIIFLRKGLNYINLNTGLGFYIEAKTLEKYNNFAVSSVNGGALAAGVAAGVLGGLIFGVVVVAIPVSYVGGRRSANSLTDVYTDATGIYFTSMKALYKVNYQGEVIWEKPLDKSIGPIRKIFGQDDDIFLISEGMMVVNDIRTFSESTLYRGAKDGRGELESRQINIVKREYVRDFLVQDSTIVVALNNRLIEVDLSDLSTVQEKGFGQANQDAGFGDILNPPAILPTDSGFVYYSRVNPDDFFVANKNGMKIRFSPALEPVEVIREKNYFSVLKELPGDRSLISNGSDAYLIDRNGKKVRDEVFTPHVDCVGNWLFDFDGNRILLQKSGSGG